MRTLILVIALLLSGCSLEAKEAARRVLEIIPPGKYCECVLTVQGDCDKWVCHGEEE